MSNDDLVVIQEATKKPKAISDLITLIKDKIAGGSLTFEQYSAAMVDLEYAIMLKDEIVVFTEFRFQNRAYRPTKAYVLSNDCNVTRVIYI